VRILRAGTLSEQPMSTMDLDVQMDLLERRWRDYAAAAKAAREEYETLRGGKAVPAREVQQALERMLQAEERKRALMEQIEQLEDSRLD
jgi:hypothetical protein